MPATKIVVTVGPASRAPKKLEALVEAGASVFRLNFSHGSHTEHGEVIQRLRSIASRKGIPLAILQDLQGPKIRIGPIAGEGVLLKEGQEFTLTTRPVTGDETRASLSYTRLPGDVSPGDTLLLSDGALELRVLESGERDIRCRVIIGGPLTSHKGINLPDSSIKAPSLTKKDREDMRFGLANQVDYMALSFIRNAGDIQRARRFLQRQGGRVPLIAKIEKHEALDCMDDIIAAADGIMVARGDLGVEIPLEKIPLIQKKLIQKSRRAAKPVITATQMLRSMVSSPRPTRAEVTDVANAILDGTDAVMLSEESAVGRYPVEAVAMLARIADDAETDSGYASPGQGMPRGESLPESVSFAACQLAESIGASALITFTQSGGTARLAAKYRPKAQILAPTPVEDTFRQLALSRGVRPILCPPSRDTDDMIRQILKTALDSRLVKKGQRVVITAGVPVWIKGSTNMIKAEILK
jgi:pyruvate kinase